MNTLKNKLVLANLLIVFVIDNNTCSMIVFYLTNKKKLLQNSSYMYMYMLYLASCIYMPIRTSQWGPHPLYTALPLKNVIKYFIYFKYIILCYILLFSSNSNYIIVIIIYFTFCFTGRKNLHTSSSSFTIKDYKASDNWPPFMLTPQAC